jgi:hypothetical protein
MNIKYVKITEEYFQSRAIQNTQTRRMYLELLKDLRRMYAKDGEYLMCIGGW